MHEQLAQDQPCENATAFFLDSESPRLRDDEGATLAAELKQEEESNPGDANSPNSPGQINLGPEVVASQANIAAEPTRGQRDWIRASGARYREPSWPSWLEDPWAAPECPPVRIR